MQFSEMKTEVRRRLDESAAVPVDDVEGTVFWTADDIGQALNEGYDEMADATEWYEVSDTLNLVQDKGYYNLRLLLALEPLRVTGAYNNTTSRWIDPVSLSDLDNFTYPRWQSTTGTPERWFLRSLWQFGVFPIPAAAASSLDVYLSSMPAALSADADTPDFPQEFHFGIVEYALYDLFIQDGEIQEALMHYERYLDYERRLGLYVQERSLDRVRRHDVG